MSHIAADVWQHISVSDYTQQVEATLTEKAKEFASKKGKYRQVTAALDIHQNAATAMRRYSSCRINSCSQLSNEVRECLPHLLICWRRRSATFSTCLLNLFVGSASSEYTMDVTTFLS